MHEKLDFTGNLTTHVELYNLKSLKQAQSEVLGQASRGFLTPQWTRTIALKLNRINFNHPEKNKLLNTIVFDLINLFLN